MTAATSAPPDTSDAFLGWVADRLAAAAAGHRLPENVADALRALVTINRSVEVVAASTEAVERVVASLAAALEPACRHFAGRVPDYVLDLGLRSAGGIARCYGPDAMPPSLEACELVVDWTDAVVILLNEIDSDARWQRLRARAEMRFGVTVTTSEMLH